MKFAFSNLACPDWTVEETVEAGVRLGYDGLELRLLGGEVIDPVADAGKIGRAAKVARDTGLPICAFDSSCRFNLADSEERAHQVEELLAWIRLAGGLGVPVVRVFGGAPEAGDRASDEEANTRVVESLRGAAPDAEREGVTVALETHDAFSSARRVAAVLAGVPSPGVGALWDSHHPYRIGESTQEVIELLGPRIVHAHAKDARRAAQGGSDWQLVLLGEGEVPVRQQLEALRRAGYHGYVSIEWEKKWHPEIAEPEVPLPQGIAWLREHSETR
jgi:sugar phosphate isomerase/epimerase